MAVKIPVLVNLWSLIHCDDRSAVMNVWVTVTNTHVHTPTFASHTIQWCSQGLPKWIYNTYLSVQKRTRSQTHTRYFTNFLLYFSNFSLVIFKPPVVKRVSELLSSSLSTLRFNIPEFFIIQDSKIIYSIQIRDIPVLKLLLNSSPNQRRTWSLTTRIRNLRR